MGENIKGKLPSGCGSFPNQSGRESLKIPDDGKVDFPEMIRARDSTLTAFALKILQF
jgi:hypothetical protein